MNNLNNVIEDYLTGKLSAQEISDFENLVSDNSDVKKELNSQKEIIESIKQARRHDLKTKLSTMNPKAGATIPQKLIIATSTLIGAAIVSLGIYSAAGNKKVEQVNNKVNIPTEITEISIPENSSTIISKKSEANKTITIQEETVTEKSNITVSEKKTSDITKPVSEKIDIDNLVLDDISDELDEIHRTEENVAEMTSSSISTTNQITYSVKTDCNQTENGYTYNAGTLQLCGDFKESEFVIYKDGSTGNFYFAYKNDYYKIVESNSFEKFENNILKDSKTIKRLPK